MRGRPKKPKGQTRQNVLRIRLTADERKLFDLAAKEQGLDTSAWARSELVILAKREKDSSK
jgi:uncharacterized protein (DUF1778 family)